MKKLKGMLEGVLMLCVLVLSLSGTSLASDFLPTLSLWEESEEAMDVDAAVNTVEKWADVLQNAGQIDTAEGMEQMADVAEIMIYRTASRIWNDEEREHNPSIDKDAALVIDKDAISSLTEKAFAVRAELERCLALREIELERELPAAVRFTMQKTNVSLTIMPDIWNISADGAGVSAGDTTDRMNTVVIVKTPRYQISLPLHVLEDDLEEPLQIELRSIGESLEPLIEVDVSNEQLAGFLVLSLPAEDTDSSDTDIMILENLDGEATACQYSGLTESVDGKISSSGIYTIRRSDKASQLTDLGDLEESMRNAIKRLYNQNVTNGTSATTFSPYALITRGAFVKLIVNAIHRYNAKLTPDYTDVTISNYYFHHAASAQRYKFMEGYSDHTFQGGNNLTRAHICKILGNVLVREKYFKVPANPSKYLEQYQDGVVSYAQDGVALLTKIGVLRPVNGKFNGSHQMSRGEVAALLDAVLKKLI